MKLSTFGLIDETSDTDTVIALIQSSDSADYPHDRTVAALFSNRLRPVRARSRSVPTSVP